MIFNIKNNSEEPIEEFTNINKKNIYNIPIRLYYGPQTSFFSQTGQPRLLNESAPIFYSNKTMPNKPLIIAHRGYCSIFPENTLASIQAALYKCDFVEFDLQLTKDHKVILFHDRHMSRLTNVAELPKFASKKRVAPYELDQEHQQREDWWISDFTYEELQQLTIKQAFHGRPRLKGLKFTIPTFQEVIEEVLDIKKNNSYDNQCGFLVELKSLYEFQYDPQDLILVQKTVEIMKRYGLDTESKCKGKNLPIILESFSHSIMEYLAESELELPLVHLFEYIDEIDQDFLELMTVKKMIGIAITLEVITPALRQLCDQRNLQIFYWTLRDDIMRKIPFKLESYKQAYHHLMKLGINGFITEYPENCQQYINEYNMIKI